VRARRRWPRLSEIHTIVFDFDGVFTDNKVYLNDQGSEFVRCDRADGLAMDFLRHSQRTGRHQIALLVLSKEQNAVVAARAKKLGLECRHGVADKLAFMESYLAERQRGRSRPWAGLVYLGNDLNDLPVLERAGFSVAPEDAHPLVKRRASLVLRRRGGEGFVRAFVEELLGVPKMSRREIHELVSDR
jgi:3-deoxy-D-manno-octulosonate 8-phosphate phosphatase (KDO 8-P phosphatase)